MRAYPLSVEDERHLPDDYDGNVFVWDIDKTYLVTQFSSLKGLLRIPLEFAVDKRAIAGMPELLRGLRHGPGPHCACMPLYFISASPPQIRKVIEQKMMLDGVEYDGITFKDWVGALRGRRPGRLREQVGFKICALLTGRTRRPHAREYLFGDDVERDADAFYLYSRLLSGELAGGRAEQILAEAGIAEDDRRCIRALVEALPRPLGTVERIFIHLERRTPPVVFARYGGVVSPVTDSCQLGLALFEAGLVPADSVQLACAAVRAEVPGADVDASIADAQARRLVSLGRLAQLQLQ